MTREEVHEALATSPVSFLKTEEAEYPTDEFRQHGLHVYYAGAYPAVEFVEVHSAAAIRFTLFGIDVFGTPASDLLVVASQHGSFKADDAEPGSYTCMSLSLCLWRSDDPIGLERELEALRPELDAEEIQLYERDIARLGFFESVGCGVPEYYVET
ncbi:MAG: hypothetical protein AAGG50_05750 [Bacteroidota bacterium]